MEKKALAARLDATDLPYDPARQALYTVDELLAPWPEDPRKTVDEAITEHFVASGGCEPPAKESLTRRLHDYAIDEAVAAALGRRTEDRRRLVGIMGGHSTSRRDPFFARAARCAFRLRKAGYKVMTGGGPGTMEAANLGAYIAAEWAEPALDEALGLLASGPDMPERADWRAEPALVAQYHAYRAAARAVRDAFPRRPREAAPGTLANVAMPTWFYGWEPTNLFADAVAKYFSNSLREDGLLSICVGGVVYAPGSLGTTQEIFADAAQNHYEVFGLTSPMVFLGVEHWSVRTSHHRLVRELSAGHAWSRYVALTDDPSEVVAFLDAHPAARLR